MPKASLARSFPAFHRGDDFSHVAGDAGNPQQAGFFVQQIVEGLSAEIVFAHQVSEYAGIDGARTRAHHQAFQRSEAHGGVDAAAVLDGGQRAAVSQMTGYDLQCAQFFAQELRSALRRSIDD